jgi:hypothetical protein
MNERIREILKQATQYADSLGPIDGAEWCDAEYSKFAELIVRECAKRSAELGQPELGKGLMKQFGVEECQ